MADTASELLKQSGFDSSSMDVNKSLEQQITNWSSAGTVPPEQNNPIDNPINLPVSSPIVSLPSFQPKQTKEDDVLSALKSLSANIESGSDYHPEDDMYTSKAALPGDFERYDQYTPGLDNEQLAFARQTGTERVAKSVANMANSFTKTLVESVTAPFVGVGYMLKGATEGEGVFNKAFYDNPYMKLLEKWQGFDLYESKQRKNAAWYSPDYWMTANSLNSLLTTVGDLAAFGVSGKFFYGPMMGAISKPIVGAIDKGYWKALNEIAEFNAVVPAGAEGKAAMGELSQAMKRITEAGMADPEKLNASTKLIRDISKRYMSQMNTWNRVQQGSLGVVNFLGSAQASALESSTSFRAKLIEKFQENKGRDPNEDEIQKIDEAANEVGATTGALMTVMGAVTLHGMFKGILAKKDGQALIRNEIKALAEGAPKEVEILGAKTMVPQYTAQVEKEITSKAGKLFTPVKRAGKAIYNRLDPMTGIGFLEFGLAPTSVESYYEKKYTDGDASIIEDALIPNVKNMFTKEGATSFFTGLFAGSIMKAVQGRGVKDTRDRDTEMALDAINQTYLKSYLKAIIDAIKRGKILQKEYLSSIQDGDKEAELTLRQQMLENWLYPRIKYNSTSLVFKELEGYKKLAVTEEGMKELQADGVVPEGDNIKQLREDFIKHIDYIETYAKNAEVYYDTMKLRYGSYVDKNGEPVFKDEHFEKLMLLSGSIDDASLRLKSLIEDIKKSELSSDPKSMQIFTNLIKEYEKMKIKEVIPFGEGKSVVIDAEKGLGKLTTQQTKELFKRITDLSINPDKRDMLANKFADYLKLSIKKKQYLDQYESIVSNPEINADTIKETIAAPSTSTDELRDTIDLIHGNSKTVDGKVVPSTVELGTEYYVQSKPIVGMYGDKMGTIRDFVKFKILGEKDGKLTVSYEKDGTTYTTEVPKDYFKDKKIAKVSDVEKNVPAKFAIEHAGDIFVYRNPKVKLNGEEETIGDIFFDPTDKQLKFRYRGKDGKIKLQDIDIKDFDEKVSTDAKGKRIVTPAKLQFKDKVKRLSAEELDSIRKYKESEADRMQREKVAKGKLGIIRDLINKKKEKLKTVEDDLLDHEIKLEAARKELEKVRTEIEQNKETRKGLDPKRHMNSMLKTATELGRVIENLEKTVLDLEAQSEDIRSEIDYLDDIDVTDLPNGRQLIKFLDENRTKLNDVVIETGLKINALNDFINKSRKVLSDIIDNVLNRIALFESKYLGGQAFDEATSIRDFRNRQLEAKDWAFVDETGKITAGAPDITGEFFDALDVLKSGIREAEEFEIPLKEKQISDAVQEIENLYNDLKSLGKEIKLSNELYDAFSTALKEYEKEQAKIALYESPEARAAISAEQRLINQRNNKTNPVNDPEELLRLANEKKLSTKSIESVFLSSVTPSSDQRPEGGWTGPAADNDGWVDRWNEFTANNNLGFAGTEKKEGTRYVTDDPDYRANMKIIVVTYNNQKHYFAPDSAFIKPGYEFGPKSVDNKTDAKDATIAYVHVYVANDGLWFVGKNGELLSKVGTKDADPNRVVFTRMETADLQRASGFNKYHADGFTPEQIIEIQKKALEERGKILAHEGESGVYDYVESRGIANEEKFTEGEKTGKTKSLGTSVVDAKLVPESAIGTGVIVIPTLSSNAEKPGFVVAGDNAVPMTVGYPVLVYNNNVAYLSGKKFSGKEVDHLYSVIKAMAENYLKTGKISKQFTDYLSSVLYFRDSYGGEAGNNQFGFDNQGNLVFGINKKPVKFLAEEIEANKVLIKEFLSNANHNVSNRALEEKGFNEITSIDKEGEPVLRTWNSYEEYLLSAKNNEGKGKRDGDIPLTVNIKQSEQAWQTPFKNKYIRPLFGEDYFDQIVPEREVKQPEPKPTEPSAEIEFDKPTQYTDADGNKFTYTPRKLGNMTIVEISSAVDKDGNRLNQDLIDDKTVEIRDVITKPVEKKPEEPAPVSGTPVSDIDAQRAEIEKRNTFTRKDAETIAKEDTAFVKKGSPIVDVDSIANTLRVGDKITFFAEKERTGVWNGKGIVDKDKNSWGLLALLAKTDGWLRNDTKISEELAALGKEEAGTKQPEIIAEEFTKEDARSTPADVVDIYDALAAVKEFINSNPDSSKMDGGWELMEKIPGEDLVEVGDRKAEKEFIESVIPQIKYEELPDFIRTGNGTAAYGMYKNYYIALYKDAPIGTGYHETWHAVEHSFLNDRSLNDLRKEFFGRQGTFTDRFGREISYSKPEGVEMKYDSKEKREYFEKDGKKIFVANEYDRRERLAEEFRQFKANNPEFQKPSLATNIFKRILNFIKHFVLGKPETIEGVFKKINAGYYRHSRFVKRVSEGPEYSAMKGISEANKAYILQGITYKIIDNLRRSHGDIMKVAEGVTVYDMFEPVYKQLEDYYTNEKNINSIWGRLTLLLENIKKKNLPADIEAAEIENLAVETADARKVWEYIKANKADVNKDIKDYFRKHKVIFTKDKNVALREMEESEVKNHDSETIGIEYYDDNKDRGYDRDIFKIDMKDSAPIEIKLLFSFLTQTEGKNPNGSKVFGEELLKPQQKLSPVLLPMTVDTSKYIYRVLDEMEGITDPAMIKRKLNEMAIEDPVLYALYAPIYKNPETLNDWRLQISFNKFAAKVKPVYLAWRIDETGRSYIMNSNIDSDARLLISQWETSMRGDDTGLTVVDKESGVFTLNVDKIKNVPSSKEESVIAFLKELNFPIDKKAVAKLSKGDKASLIAETANFYAILKKGEKFKPISYKSIKATSLGRIVELLSKTGVIKNPSSHSNVNGDKVQNHVMFNRLNRAMSSIIEAGTINNLKKLNPRLFTDTWSKDSILIKAGGPLFDNDGYLRKEVKDGTDFKMIVAEGLINDKDYKNKATSTDKMNKAVRFMNMLNMNLGQRDTMIFFNFIPADSTTETGVRMSPYIGRKEFRDGTYKKEFNETATGYLKSEIELIKENILGLRTITENARKGDAYKNLQTFKDILVDKDGMPNQELVKKITDYAQGLGADKDKTTDDFLKSVKSEVEQALDNFFENNTKEKMEFLENYRLLQKQVDGKYKFYGVNIDFVESMDYGKDGLFTEKEIKDILKYRHLNLFMHNTEMRKLFYGPWYEVPDAVKRDKLSMSGSEKTYAGDVEFSTWARQNLNKVGDVNLVNGEFGYHSYNDNFNVFTYDHDKGISSFYYDQIEEVIGKEKAAPYLNVEESDGQAIVLDTHWKDYVLRSGDMWNDDYEKQHQFDLASARKEYYSRKGNVGYRKELMDADQAIIDAGDPMVYGIGNPKKPIGAGMLNNDSQAIPYAFKTSIMRLSYTVAKERGLENLYWWMHDNNIGMTGPKSFQKYGRLYSEELKGLPELYKMDKDGKPYVALKDITKEQMSQLTLNVDWSDFNKIVEVPKGKTGKTMGSQLRSLVLLNSFHYGLPVDFYKEGENYAQKWEEWKNMNEDQRKESSDRYRMFKDNDDAISEIAKRGYDKAMSTLGMTEKDGEYEFTNVNKVVDYLRSEITRRDLPDNVADGLTWEIDDAGYERLKYPLEVLPNYQALKSMIWSVVDKNVIRPKLNGTDLVLVSSAMWEKGVRVTVDKNGKKFLSSSELKFYQRGENGAKTSLMEVYAPNIFREKLMKWKESNPDKATMSDEQLLDYLNETEEGKKLLSMIGFRIPTQGMNSVDAVKIAGFLHPSMGDSIVVPSEMVTKAGADFDIDKMGTYYYNFYINKEGVPKLVEFLDDSNSTAEERYVKYINDHSKNKGDIDALKASSEYKEMDNMYERTKESAKNLYERGVSEKADYRKQIEDFKEANNDQYARGKEFFRQLPLQYKEWFWDMEQDFQSQQIKGITKIQEYHAFTNDLIESIKLDIATDKAKEQDRAALPYLEAMAEVSKVTLENYDISEQHIADYKKFRDDIKENVKKGQVSLFDSLIANQKKYFKQWLLEASKIVAEARGIESFEDFSNKSFYEQNSREAVENKYYETLQDIVTHPDNFEQIVTPNSSKEMTDIEKKISDLQMTKKDYERKKGRSKNDINYSNLLDPIFLSNERHDFIEAKGTLVGIGAQNNTFHALAQTQPIFVENFEKLSNFNREYFSYKTGEKDPATGKEIMDYDYNIYLAHNKLNVDGVMKTTYSGTRDTVGSFISDKISQYINGAVDAVKDTWLIRLIKNKDLMGTAIFLDRIGVSAEHVFTFINQPIIQEYIKEQDIRKSVKGINTDIYDRFKNDTISDIMKLTYASDSEKFAPTKVDFNLKDMYKMIELAGRDGKKLNELPAEYREMQRQILHEFIKYELMGKDSLTDQMAIMWGNISGINDAVIKDKNATIDLAQKTSVINASSSILANTFQGKIKNSADKIANAIEKILKVSASPALDHIEKHILNKAVFMKGDDRAEVLERATFSLIDFATQTKTKVAGQYLNARIAELLLDPTKNTAKLLKQMRNDPSIKGQLKELLNNPILLGKLQPSIGKDVKTQRNIKIQDKPNDSLDANMFTEALRQLRDNEITNGLYKRIVLTGILQSGVRDGKVSFNKFIPYEDYMKELMPAVDAILNMDISKFEDTMAFYRANYNDPRIVPELTKIEGEFGSYVPYYTENNILSNYLPERLKSQGETLQAPKFVIVSKKADLQHPVLKVKIRGVDPETGLEYTSGDASEMASGGDYSFITTRIFQKVMDEMGNPLSVGKDYRGNEKYLYKQINAWGNNLELQEYYDTKRPSTLAIHEKVYELEDWQIMLAIRETRFVEAPKEENVSTTVTATKPAPTATILEKGITVKPTIDLSKEWKGDLESRSVYTKEGVNTMRTSAAKANEHFGNPFSEGGYAGTIKVATIGEAVSNYKDWLLGNRFKDVKPEQRVWILDQINQGKLDGATLLYSGKLEARGEGMHPTALAEVVEQLRKGTTVVKDDAQPTTNIYWSTGENKNLSNLAPRKFTYGGKEYYSVEHAYQTLKSGKFDETTYNKYKESAGNKIQGTQGTDTSSNIGLMKDLIKTSFEQNPTALKELLATGESKLTHAQDNTIWKTEFPRILMEVRNELKKGTTEEGKKPNSEPGDQPKKACA